ncbi:hypothetical protein NSERKGN1266_47980 [Nocardia seriolae]|nr:hypothetical protein NSERKGN1266_47980 [Nocardia seriolae]
MAAGVPDPVRIPDAQHHIHGERVALDIDGRAGVLVHPGAGRGPRIGLLAQVDAGPAGPPAGIDDLVRDAVDLEQAHVADFAFGAEAFDGVEQPAHVQIAVDLHELRDGQRNVGPDALGVPEG